MWRLISAWDACAASWHGCRSALPVQLGVYAVAAVAMATVALSSLDHALFALGGGVDQQFASSHGNLGQPRRTLEGPEGAPIVQSWVLAVQPTIVPGPPASARPIEPLKISRPPLPPTVTAAADPRTEWYSGGGGTYTTVCVRLCDGSYRPVSFSTTEERFADDARACQSSCGSPSRLYVYPNPGGSMAESEDLTGQPYARLKTAFLFKTTHVASCTCQAQPWDEAARDRHRIYALQERAAKGDAKAKAELKQLGSQVAALTKAPGSDLEISEGNGTSFKARGLASAPSANGQSGNRSSQWVASGSWTGSGIMRLGASPSSSSRSSGGWSGGSSSRSSGSSSRDTGWKSKAFDTR